MQPGCDLWRGGAVPVQSRTDVALYSQARIVETLAKQLAHGTMTARNQMPADARQLSAKFAADTKDMVYTMSYGALDVFFGGLEKLLGPPRMIDGARSGVAEGRGGGGRQGRRRFSLRDGGAG